MPHLRIAMAQVNATVGDISANADLVMDWSKQAADAGAHLVLFPEMMLTGYPVEDLALRRSFVEASRISINRLAARLLDAGLGDLVAVVGYLDRIDEPDHPKGGHPQNVAAVLHQGQVICSYAKHHLPNYGVFDEYRYFKPGNELHVLRIRGIDVAIAICEDLWQDGGPVAATAEANAGLLAVINASPYERDKDDVRGDLVRRRAREAGCPLAYVNLVGGQDELVFDGDTMIAREDGTTVVRALQFVEDLVVADLELAPGTAPQQAELAEGTVPAEFGQSGMIIVRHHISDAGGAPTELITPVVAKPLEAMAEVYLALVMGLRDYCSKNGIERVYLGLSGG
ncbi:MAG TPA: nitrilase-related carbon-nitrogen hydrolase, partial [Propionibacteriaceae bacterium]|nr:nitrilase-related carbon-nitrogen hydrolase [Propionibacteriaceae bacterium]